jgi:hypothetical protein
VGGTLTISELPLFMVISYYCVVGGGIWLMKNRKKQKARQT